MKSALELAMEKAEKLEGGKARKLTEAQRQQIAETRKVAEAKKAEIKIMMDDKIKKFTESGVTPDELTAVRREFTDRMDKIDRDTESAVEKIKSR